MTSKRGTAHGGTPFDAVAQQYHGSAPMPANQYAEFIVQQCALQPGSWVVELGCGSGTLAIALARLGMRVTAVDCSRVLLEIARGAGWPDGPEWIEARAEEYAPGSAREMGPSLVLSYEAFHLFSDRAAVVARAASYLRLGGCIAVGWCDYHWESVLRDVIVAVFAEFGIDWGQWGSWACPEFVEIIASHGELFTSVCTRSIRAGECTALVKVAQFLASTSKAASADVAERTRLQRRLAAEFTRTVGCSELSGDSTYWLRSASLRARS